MSEAEFRFVMSRLRKRLDAMRALYEAVERGELELRRYYVRSYKVRGYEMPAHFSTRIVKPRKQVAR